MRNWLGRRVLVIAIALVVIAAGFTAVAGWKWAMVGHEPRAVARDEALRAGEQAIATFNTLDSRRVDEGFDRWLAVSTGTLHQELTQQRGDGVPRLAATSTVTEARVLDAAVTELDEQAGTATVIASVEITVARDGAPPVPKHDRIEARLTRTGSGWKLGGIGQVAVAVP
ncbi:hypothetical protein [Saccharopolyspora taberi]|uniref:Mce-associated membrane protein n=1 Tax=Saccharopolyspora taberi TaxID=60895 RepID=A0ABN3VE48_9PSEU